MVRLVLALLTWVTVLLVLGPSYVMTWHDWSYMDAVWYIYTTMTSIGYGDLYPNVNPTSFNETVLARPEEAENDHPVYIWCQGVTIIFGFVAVFSFGVAALGEMRREKRERKIAMFAEARGAQSNRVSCELDGTCTSTVVMCARCMRCCAGKAYEDHVNLAIHQTEASLQAELHHARLGRYSFTLFGCL